MRRMRRRRRSRRARQATRGGRNSCRRPWTSRRRRSSNRCRYYDDVIEPALLEDRIRQFVAASVPSLDREHAAVLAASGGGDSTAMIALLCETGIVQPGRCVVAHFDHRLRGEAAADADRCAVEAVCVRYGLRLVTGTWEAPRPGEAAAREARYAFLLETCSSSGLRVVV